MQIAWEDQSASAFCRADDKVNFIVYNQVQGRLVTFEAAAERADQLAELQLPVEFSAEPLHIWMNYVNVNGDMVSTSAYFFV